VLPGAGGFFDADLDIQFAGGAQRSKGWASSRRAT
jgi:hypothetical protein